MKKLLFLLFGIVIGQSIAVWNEKTILKKYLKQGKYDKMLAELGKGLLFMNHRFKKDIGEEISNAEYVKTIIDKIDTVKEELLKNKFTEDIVSKFDEISTKIKTVLQK